MWPPRGQALANFSREEEPATVEESAKCTGGWHHPGLTGDWAPQERARQRGEVSRSGHAGAGGPWFLYRPFGSEIWSLLKVLWEEEVARKTGRRGSEPGGGGVGGLAKVC